MVIATNIIIGLRGNKTFLKEIYNQVDLIPEDRDLSEVLPIETIRTTEVEDILGIASDTIGSLLRLIMLVRKATPRDRHAHALRDHNEPFPKTFDINHVKERYPKLDRPGSEWLLDRLGGAITSRRQFLRYFREHKERLLGGSLHQSDSLKPHSVKASTFDHSRFIKNNNLPLEHAEDSENAADTASYTSVTTSVDVPSEDRRLNLPALVDVKQRWSEESYSREDNLQPESHSGEFFECPLCAQAIAINQERSWKLHVHEDLKSYVCCLGKGMCDSKMFGSQREWFNHELENHRRQWICIICKQGPFGNPDSFNTHLLHQHQELNNSNQAAEALKSASQCPVKSISTKECPFCDDWKPKTRESSSEVGKGKSKAILRQEVDVVSPSNFRRHVAIHLEQLAMFAIPRDILDPREPSLESDGSHAFDSSRSSLASAMEEHVALDFDDSPGREVRTADDISFNASPAPVSPAKEHELLDSENNPDANISTTQEIPPSLPPAPVSSGGSSYTGYIGVGGSSGKRSGKHSKVYLWYCVSCNLRLSLTTSTDLSSSASAGRKILLQYIINV